MKKIKKGLEVAALVVGLGNREVTPDALGPRVVDNLFITRHILNEFGKYAFQREDVGKVSGIVPGVMAQTGMECVEILKGVVKETKPDFLITVDALAARSIRRLGRTIQLTDTGITPGSGIGNHRNAINRKKCGRSRDFSRCADGRGCGNDCLGCHDGIYFRIIAFGSAEAG